MKSLNPQPPFVWPEPRVIENIRVYERQPPYEELALTSLSMFGLLSAITERGVDLLNTWFERNPELQVRLIVMVYPACATRQEDLSLLLDLVKSRPDRLSVHIYPLERVTDRGTNALCFVTADSDTVRLVTGTTEDLGLNPRQKGHVNFVFRADPALVEAFKRYFDWLWFSSREITAKGVALIPDLVLPEGTEEGARMWSAYFNGFMDADTPLAVPQIDPDTGDITIRSEDGQNIHPPTEEIGLAKLDQLAERMARLYDKGVLVSIDKLSRIPPLDAPLDPSLFGDAPELQRGNVTRKVSMRVSIIDEKTLKEIDKRKQGLRVLLTKFTFGLADNMRWMPTAARELFESEVKRLNDEGQKLILDLLKGDVDKFIEEKRPSLVADINAMHRQLGRPGQVTEDVINRVVENLKGRLGKAHSGNFMPKLSYSAISFARTDNTLVSPWGQAFSLLADVAAFPRKALTDRFFFSGLKVQEDDLIEIMNVADDALCRDLRDRGIKGRCKDELELLSRIEKASIELRERCELVWRILAGDSITAIDEALKNKEAEMVKENSTRSTSPLEGANKDKSKQRLIESGHVGQPQMSFSRTEGR